MSASQITHASLKLVPCVMNALETSVLVSNLYLEAINNKKTDGGVYLESSVGNFTEIVYKNLRSLSNKGNCFQLLNASLLIDKGEFYNYGQNCLLIKESDIKIDHSLFNNFESDENRNEFLFGTVYCESCYAFSVSNSFSQTTLKAFTVVRSALISNSQDFNISGSFCNVTFRGNQANAKGGAIYLNNVHASFNQCNFIQNKADQGAAIFFLSSGNIFFGKSPSL